MYSVVWKLFTLHTLLCLFLLNAPFLLTTFLIIRKQIICKIGCGDIFYILSHVLLTFRTFKFFKSFLFDFEDWDGTFEVKLKKHESFTHIHQITKLQSLRTLHYTMIYDLTNKYMSNNCYNYSQFLNVFQVVFIVNFLNN